MMGAPSPKMVARTARSRRDKRIRLAARALGFLAVAQDLIDGARELSEGADALEEALTKAHRAVRGACAVLSSPQGDIEPA